jgi:arylsulfatase
MPGKDGSPGAVNDHFNYEGGLYDLRRDPGEHYNVKFLYPEVVKTLEKIAEEASEEQGEELTKSSGKKRRKHGILNEK